MKLLSTFFAALMIFALAGQAAEARDRDGWRNGNHRGWGNHCNDGWRNNRGWHRGWNNDRRRWQAWNNNRWTRQRCDSNDRRQFSRYMNSRRAWF